MIQQLIQDVLRREGGYVNHSADRGGPTNMGITIATLSGFRGYPCTQEDVMLLEEAEAYLIYEKLYWINPGFHTLDLDEDTAELVFDIGVHSGPNRAIKMLQNSLGVVADGVIGPVTRSAAAQAVSLVLFHDILAQRLVFIGRLITKDPSQAAFAHGWLRRLSEFLTGYGM